MTTLRYHLLDVFTAERYQGNPLAVFVDPPALTDGQMQRIANELNLSETVFTAAPGRAGDPWPTRIFTPTSELPFAGHPTVGTACLLGALGHVGPSVVLDELVGEVVVTLDGDGGTHEAWLTLPRAAAPLPLSIDPGAVATALRLGVGDLHPTFAVEVWSAGVPFTIVPVRGVDALSRSSVDAALWERALAGSAAPDLYVVTPLDAVHVPRRWRARMYAPGHGIREDPATGSAAAAFSGYLLARLDGDVDDRWDIAQGSEMGRPGTIGVRMARHGDGPPTVQVGGRAVLVGEGTLIAPDP